MTINTDLVFLSTFALVWALVATYYWWTARRDVACLREDLETASILGKASVQAVISLLENLELYESRRKELLQVREANEQFKNAVKS